MCDMQTAHMPVYLMPKQELARDLGPVILYRFLHFQDLRSMETTSRRDGTGSDAKRGCRRVDLPMSEGYSTEHSRLVACLSGAGVPWDRGISDKIQGSVKKREASYNQYTAVLLSDAPMSSPHKTAWKGQTRATTPCNFILSTIFWRLSVCFIFTSDLIIFSVHPCSTLLADCSLYRESLTFSYIYTNLFPLSFLISILLFSFLFL